MTQTNAFTPAGKLVSALGDPDRLYVNEYTAFVRSGPEGITAVFESPNTAEIQQLYAQQAPKH